MSLLSVSYTSAGLNMSLLSVSYTSAGLNMLLLSVSYTSAGLNMSLLSVSYASVLHVLKVVVMKGGGVSIRFAGGWGEGGGRGWQGLVCRDGGGGELVGRGRGQHGRWE